MYQKLKRILKQLSPPLFVDIVKQILPEQYGYSGSYDSWQQALKYSDGYDQNQILTKVESAISQVKRGEAVFERDSVLFDEIIYSWPILVGILKIAAAHKNSLKIIDFGGSLGSHYYQYKYFLDELDELIWTVVEQENFVQVGNQKFKDLHLNFYSSIPSALENVGNYNAILLSSVIQYLESPYSLLNTLVDYEFEYILVDRTPLLAQDHDRLTIQKVPREIYNASYPAWFLSRKRFLKYFAKNYNLLVEFDALAGVIDLRKPFEKAIDKGFIFKHKTHKF
jgi:putative methyltransferase (TIGR04325 family)